MNKNVFDMGYEIRYPSGRNGYAELLQQGNNPILAFYKARSEPTNRYYSRPGKEHWYIRELTLTDDVLNELLPPDWQIMKNRGFKKVEDIRRWLSGL